MGRSKFFGVPGFVWAFLTPLAVALIEACRVYDIALPTPFLLLLIAAILPAGAAGLTAGIVTGLISSAYVIYAAFVSFGPPTLTGGVTPIASGVIIYFSASVFVGWVSRYQSARFNLQKHEATRMQGLVDSRTNQLTAAEQRFHDFATASSDWFWEMGPDLRFTWFSEEMETKMGVPKNWCIGKTRDELLHASSPAADWKAHKEDLHHHRPFRHFRYLSSLPSGEKWFLVSGAPLFSENGTFVGYRGTGSDVTQLVVAETDATKTHTRLATAIEGLGEAFVIWDVDDTLLMCNEKFRAANAIVPNFTKPGTPFQTFIKAIIAQTPNLDTPKKRDAFLRDRLKQHRSPVGTLERQRPDGSVLLVKEQVLPDGTVVSVSVDITERRTMEQRLIASQRLEAIGQLTGGIAHDFNNLLAVIQGNAELMTEITGETNDMLDAILRASAKGAVLTGQLLAFSRKQPLRPRAVNITSAVEGLANMVSRTLGERIILECRVAPKLWNAKIDPTQTDAVLMNLLINARDAMPDGGNIVIECTNAVVTDNHANPTAEISPGDYVLLSVSDSGSGMSPETLARVFEPFFTTKEVGKGSGMGLSMVYGFAKQSGGHITIFSEPGNGTTVNLYLPRAKVAGQSPVAPIAPDELRGEGETILILEDNPDVLEIAIRMLEQLGYKARGVLDAAQAHKLLESGFDCDLVLSDVIMPGGTSGPQFAKEIATTHPDLRFIFMSGFSETSAERGGVDRAERVSLNKPFHRSQLAAAVHVALAANPDKT